VVDAIELRKGVVCKRDLGILLSSPNSLYNHIIITYQGPSPEVLKPLYGSPSRGEQEGGREDILVKVAKSACV
jgi:hypothetical protein